MLWGTKVGGEHNKGKSACDCWGFILVVSFLTDHTPPKRRTPPHTRTHSHTLTLEHYTAKQIIVSFSMYWSDHSFSSEFIWCWQCWSHSSWSSCNSRYYLHYNIQYLHGPTYLLLVVYCQHHFLHYKYLPYNHTNTSLSPCLLSLSRCSQDVSAWVARSSSHEKDVLRMGEGSRVSGLEPRPGSVCYCVET